MAEKNSNSIFSLIAMLASIAVLVIVIMVFIKLPQRPDAAIVADAKKMAGELSDNNLPYAAIEEYQKILSNAVLSAKERGAINYLIGKLHFEATGDYEQAASYYIRARSLDENATYYNEAGKNLIASLEKLGRRLDARRELDMQASTKPDTASGKIVAIVGSAQITLAEFNKALQSLPSDLQVQYSTPSGKNEFLQQLIGRELIYRAAVREGLDSDKAVLKGIHNIEKDYLVQYYTNMKIIPTIKPDTSDLKMYYNANKEKYSDTEFEIIKQDVAKDYMDYLSQKAINEYINMLSKSEPIQVFKDNLK